MSSTVTPQPAPRRRQDHMFLNMGPSHPAMHGIIQIRLELDGEKIVSSDVEIGYLHRGFEKTNEHRTYTQVIPYTDRLNYVSPLINEVGYCLAVEKLFGLQTTERCQHIRVLMCEISRLTDHLTSIGASAMELGAFSAFLYLMKARELLYDLIEAAAGARIMPNYVRVGGLKADLPDGFDARARAVLAETGEVLKETHGLLTRNRIFVDRLSGVGVITAETAISHGFTGPCLRASGVGYDVRKAEPYLVYDRLDWDVPVGDEGDNYDRYLVRMEEMHQSIRIIRQVLDRMPGGGYQVDLAGREMTPAEVIEGMKQKPPLEPIQEARIVLTPDLEGSERVHAERVRADDKTVLLPPKEDVYGNIEGLMQHFKLVMYGHGIRPPQGEVYQAVEGGNGEVGFYLVSDGTDMPYRIRARGPCFHLMSALSRMIEGGTVADVIPTFGSINMIGGELDR
jgi:NADH-quinone oxidoreductase subunit D